MASMLVQTYIILVADSIRGREGGIARHHVSVFLQSAHALHAMKPFSSMQASYMQTRKAQQHPPLFRTENKKDCSKLLSDLLIPFPLHSPRCHTHTRTISHINPDCPQKTHFECQQRQKLRGCLRNLRTKALKLGISGRGGPIHCRLIRLVKRGVCSQVSMVMKT